MNPPKLLTPQLYQELHGDQLDRVNRPSKRVQLAEDEGNLHLWKMQLSLPDLFVHDSSEDSEIHEEDWVEDPLSVEELAELQEELWDDIQGVQVNGMVKGDANEWGLHQALVEELRATIHRDYDSTVLSGKFAWGPEGAPIRGPNCEAQIHLKRSEERRVGKECRIGCRSRWSPYH